MARIRTIKPEFPHSESVGRLSRDARLLFVLLWTLVDDEGRARAASRMLASLLYPYDDDAPSLITAWLGELERNELIRIYDVQGARYLEIINWLKHQKIDRPSKSRLPPFSDADEISSEVSTNAREASSTDLGPRTSTKEGTKYIRAVAKATRPDDSFEQFWKAYPKRDGANPKAPARKKYIAALKAGATADEILSATKRFAEEARSKGQIGTPYVAQAMTWLGQQRWGDYAASAEPQDDAVGGFYATATSDELQAWDNFRRRTEGKTFPRDAKGGWRVPAQWPPNVEEHVMVAAE